MVPRRIRKARKPRRRVARRVRRVPRRRAIPGAMMKSYNYTFQPNDQWIASTNNATPGDIAVVPFAPPLSAAGITSPVPSQSGFQFYYDFGLAMTFKISDVANLVNFARIYNEYKINSIQVKVTYLTTEANIQGLGLLPTMNYVMDTSNPVALTLLQDVQGKAGSRTVHVTSSRNTLTLNIKPFTRTVVATAPNNTAAAKVERAGWISCLNQDVVHYAGKFWFQNVYLPTTSTTNTALQYEYKFNVSFRGAQNLF